MTVFRARLRDDVGPELLREVGERNARMLELASKMPGFISYKDFQSDDGESVSIVEFDTLERVRAWHDHPEHREVQRWGREAVFRTYTIHTCEVVRSMRFPE